MTKSRDQVVLGIVVDAQIRFHLGQQNGLDGRAFDLYRKHRSGILVMIKRIVRPFPAAVLAVALATASAQAIVGGAEDAGPLSRESVMVLSSNGGVCSAVIVAPDVILTAAHCVTGADQHRVHFRDGGGEPVLDRARGESGASGLRREGDREAHALHRSRAAAAPGSPPAPFQSATLGMGRPAKGDAVTVAGWGLSREGEAKTTGTFRAASLAVNEPYGPSEILLWLDGKGAGRLPGRFRRPDRVRRRGRCHHKLVGRHQGRPLRRPHAGDSRGRRSAPGSIAWSAAGNVSRDGVAIRRWTSRPAQNMLGAFPMGRCSGL